MSVVKLDVNYKSIAAVAAVVLVFSLMYQLQEILTTFGISFFVAYLFDPLADKLEKLKLSRGFSVFIIFLVFILLAVVIMSYLVPVIYSEIIYLAKSFPGLIDRVFELIEKGAAYMNIDLSLAEFKKLASSKAGTIAAALANTAGTLFSSVKNTVGFLVNLALIPVLVFYFLKDYDVINEKGFDILKKKTGKDYSTYLLKFNSILSTYFRGQFIVAMILCVLYSLAFYLSGVKPAVLLGLISGVFSIVPYLGFFVGISSALVLSVIQYGDILHPVYVIVGFTIVQLLEGNIITPKIVGESLGLHPTVVIFALMVGGYLLGIGGMIFALPVAAFIKVLLIEYVCEK